MNNRQRILVLASGDKEGGGSGAQEMVEQSRTKPPILDADIVGFVSNNTKAEFIRGRSFLTFLLSINHKILRPKPIKAW